jgi:hypothetical protein
VIAEVKQCWSVMGWVTKNLLSRAPRSTRQIFMRILDGVINEEDLNVRTTYKYTCNKIYHNIV